MPKTESHYLRAALEVAKTEKDEYLSGRIAVMADGEARGTNNRQLIRAGAGLKPDANGEKPALVVNLQPVAHVVLRGRSREVTLAGEPNGVVTVESGDTAVSVSETNWLTFPDFSVVNRKLKGGAKTRLRLSSEEMTVLARAAKAAAGNQEAVIEFRIDDDADKPVGFNVWAMNGGETVAYGAIMQVNKRPCMEGK